MDDEPDLFATQDPPEPAKEPCRTCGIRRAHDDKECQRQLEFLRFARASFRALVWS